MCLTEPDAGIHQRFTHLHVHTDASRLDGLGTVESLVEYAKSTGFGALAMTDHGSLANTISFIHACKVAGIKPIVGIEGYVEVDDNVHHITVLANGNSGFHSLTQLNNVGQRSEYSRPAFSIDDLVDNSKDLYIMTGCVASPFQAMPLEEALKLGRYLLPHFEGRLFAETMHVGSYKSWERSILIAERLGIPPIVTNDVHFPRPDQAELHSILTRMKAGFDYESTSLYLAESRDIMSRTKGEPKEVQKFFRRGIDNAGRLAARLESPSFSGTSTLPHIKDGFEQLEKMCKAAVNSSSVSATKKRVWRERAKYELEIIKRMGYESYFVILHDIVRYGRLAGVRIGPGRGSAAGSLVLYLLGITEIDPTEFDLSFERFLNPYREGMPDVDIDFDSEGRDCVIGYAADKWAGVSVATYARYSHKTLVHDLAKYFKIDRSLEAKAAEGGPESDAFRQMCAVNPTIKRAYDSFLGQIRNVGKHAGGVIITDIDVPLERSAGNETLVAAWTEGDDRQLSSVGVVKYDLLGITALTVLKRLENEFGHRAPDPTDDAPEFEIFRNGDTEGIFQFSGSAGIVDYTKKVSPTTFNDIVAINALYRPGALDAGTAEHYPEWRKNPRLLHPKIDPILKPTYGVIIYQEQVMAIVAEIMGGSLGEADLARRVIVKSKVGDPEWEGKMADLLETFMTRGQERGFDEALLQLLWNELKAHARYSFNRAHAVSYARISWDLAWWKMNKPTHFYAETINSDPGETMRYLYAAATAGIRISPPHVNKSGTEWVADATTLYMPLTSIKFMGVEAAQFIVDNRPFASIDDFIERVPRKTVRANVRKNLAFLGSFEGVEGDITEFTGGDEHGAREAQIASLGFPLPSREIINTIAAIQAGGWVAGVVSEVEKRQSKYGDYWVYRLSPTGSFWIRSPKKTYERGALVAARVKQSSGKALDHKEL